MINQYKIPLAEMADRFPPAAAYSLYAALLEQLPPETAAEIHDSQSAFISQYLEGGFWHLSLLGDFSSESLSELPGHIRLKKWDCLLLLPEECRIPRSISDAETFLTERKNRFWTLRFHTPTAFKSAGSYQLLPTSRLLLQSLMQKWNCCFPDCVIEDEGMGLEAMAEGLVCHSVRLSSRSYPLKRNLIPGITGELRIENKLNGFHRILADALLEFGNYSGVGIKTSLGMGGFTAIQERREKI